jgi:OOP family OmpA-OmpF porin
MPDLHRYACLRQLAINPSPWRSLICCLPLLWITPASAQSTTQDTPSYIGASAGWLLANQMSKETINQALQQQGLAVSTNHADERSAGWKVFAGYRLHPNWALEGGYTDLGSYDFDGQVIADPGAVHARFKANDWHVALLGFIPLNDSLEIFGKAGVGYWRTHLQASGTFSAQGAQQVKAHGTSPIFGAGAILRLSTNLSARAEWERFHRIGEASGSGRADIDSATLGLQYNY